MTSTNMAPLYFRSTFFGSEDVDIDDETVPMSDFMSGRLITLLYQIKAYRIYTYPGSRPPLTTISYQHYGNTSLWWAILFYNGYIHPGEIPGGVALKIPALSTVTIFKDMLRSAESGASTQNTAKAGDVFSI